MVDLTVELLSIKKPQILNLDDLIIELECAIYDGQDITLHLAFGSVVLEVICEGGNYFLHLKSFQGCASLPKVQFFEMLMSTLSTLVEALNDELVLNQDIDLIIEATEYQAPIELQTIRQ